ncbi:MAG: universal stress protein [Magnetovibrio sp.]|nr:universal stress protein [Magnetovibrio sp.]
MTIRTILVPVRGDGKGEGVLDHALALARPFDAHINVVHCRARPEDLLPYSTVITESMRETILESARASAADEEARLQGIFMEYLETREIVLVEDPPVPEGRVSASWHEVQGRQSALVAIRGRLADVIAVAQPDADGGHQTLEAALLETGKLVLVCPDRAASTVGKHVCVGWNGSAESARAVSAAMPLLAEAEQVTVFSAPEGMEDKLSTADLTEHLGWHDIQAAVTTLNVGGAEVGNALLAETGRAGGDVLLIGGYGHSRRRELVMGGVTRHIIDHADIPVMMVH